MVSLRFDFSTEDRHTTVVFLLHARHVGLARYEAITVLSAD